MVQAGEVRWDETGTEDVEVDEEEDSMSLDVADDAEVSHHEVFEDKKMDEKDNPSMVAAGGKTEADPGLAAVNDKMRRILIWGFKSQQDCSTLECRQVQEALRFLQDAYEYLCKEAESWLQ
ncbi:hypothetical protein Vretifemale_1974 [Volvox reticuliferus]|nr:hypothetical protein Vretifemale_1974 [Volvox reticuliferus]